MSIGGAQPMLNTVPEMEVRRILHGMGLRYRVGARPVKGVRRIADILFPTQRVAVFIDGCFWHICPDHYVPPKTNQDFWRQKSEHIMKRDAETFGLLAEHGWKTLRFWEHEPAELVAKKIGRVVRG